MDSLTIALDGLAGGGNQKLYLMRGIDSGTSTYTTWIVTSPDPNGAQANAGNTTPVLVGSIIAGSGIIFASWTQ